MDIAKAMRFGAMAVFAATVLGLSAGCAAPSLTAKTKEMTHVDNAPFMWTASLMPKRVSRLTLN